MSLYRLTTRERAATHFREVLDKDPEGRFFNDAYFAGVASRIDSIDRAYMRLILAQLLIFFALSCSAFGIQPKFAQYGVELNIDTTKELLFFVYATLSAIIAMVKRSMEIYKGMMLARGMGPSAVKEVLDAVILPHEEVIGPLLQWNEGPPKGSATTRWDLLRLIPLTVGRTLAGAGIVAVNYGIFLIIAMDIWLHPTLPFFWSQAICIYALSASTMAFGVSMPYFYRRIAKRGDERSVDSDAKSETGQKTP